MSRAILKNKELYVLHIELPLYIVGAHWNYLGKYTQHMCLWKKEENYIKNYLLPIIVV